MENYLVETILEDGTHILVECIGQSGEEEVGYSLHDLGVLFSSFGSISNSIKAALEKAKPQKVTVEFGLSVKINTGKLTAILVNGDASANLKVSMTWKEKDE